MDTRPYSVFIGRFQPLHDGHKKIIQTLLDEGKRVAVCIRSTPESGENPYTIGDRVQMFQAAYPDELESEQVVMVIFPDVTEVVYGREVGYDVREIRFDAHTEAISARKIRNDLLDSGKFEIGQDDAGEDAAERDA